ncbi:MAG: hypothetical protein DRZ82_00140 [Thermoprotei archaeon]|nr:MAG: hypothetical protein DRZ82_00140 [Thermoprotei archaeon]
MNTYETLVNKFKEYVKSKGKVLLEDMKKWAEENNIGLITLSVIVNDLVTKGELKPLGEFKEVDKDELALPMPEGVASPEVPIEDQGVLTGGISKLKTITKTKAVRTSPKERRRTSRLSRISPLFKWSEEEELEVEVGAKEERKEEVKSEEKSKQELKVVKVREEPVAKLEEYEEDVRKAIIYLNRYHSVGELRFLLDLESLGVKNPREVMYKLVELGFIVRKPIGVIDATDKLPKVKIKEETSVELTRFI